MAAEPNDDAVESRRSARAPGRFWVAVEGVDMELVARRGDISATGIFFESDTDVGDAGTVQWLRVSSWDRTRRLSMMANVVRSVRLTDVNREIHGIALEFMPESDDAAVNLFDFVSYVLESPRSSEQPLQVAPRAAPIAMGPAAWGAGTLKPLSVQTLLLETDWSVPVGESVRVEIITRGKRHAVRVEGQAVSVLSAGTEGDTKRYRIAVQIKSELQGPLRRFSSVAVQAVLPRQPPPPLAVGPLDALLSALIQPPAVPPERRHLAGLLSRIPFPSLCALLELERLSGDLAITRDGEAVHLFVQNGRFVDVEPLGADPRAVIRKLLEGREGSFELAVGGIERPDRIGATMTQLLLELAQAADEEARRR